MGLVRETIYAQAIVSNAITSAHPATTAGLRAILDFLPAERRVEWSVVTFGSSALSLLGFAVEAGGHVALGLGDHPYAELGPAPTNADVVRAAVAMVRALGAEPATPTQARELLGL